MRCVGRKKSDYIFLLEVSKKLIQEIHIVEDLSNLGESKKVPFLPISPSLPSTPLPLQHCPLSVWWTQLQFPSCSFFTYACKFMCVSLFKCSQTYKLVFNLPFPQKHVSEI